MTTIDAALPAVPSAASAHVRSRRPHVRESLVLGAAALVVYVVVGTLMARSNFVFGDSVARVANAFYVLFSRDPHLPAMGFVWNPLPSLVVLPILPLKGVFPALAVRGFAGVIQSAVCMAGSVGVLAACLRKLGVSRGARLALAAIFAVQPMVLIYAGSGESEPMLIMFLLLTINSLLSWLRDTQRAGSLVAVGLFLGLAYLTRYEAVASAAAVATVVAVVSFRRATGGRERRWHIAANDLMLAMGPFAFAFVLWAGASKVIVGEWFPTFASEYGNSAQVATNWQYIGEQVGGTPGARLGFAFTQTVALAPLFIVLLAVAMLLAVRRRDGRIVPAVFVLGSVMVFNAGTLIAGQSFGWLRFQMYVIPLTALLAGAVVGHLRGPARSRGHDGQPEASGNRARVRLATAAVIAAVAVGLVTQAIVLTDPTSYLAREEAGKTTAMLRPPAPSSDPGVLDQFVAERRIAAYLDRMGPGSGSVLTDSAAAFPVIVASTDPRQFVITSDFDFESAVADPAADHVHYALISDSTQDSLREWPGQFRAGGGSLALVKHWSGVPRLGYPSWDLYRVGG